jgi:hypothetical protein
MNLKWTITSGSVIRYNIGNALITKTIPNTANNVVPDSQVGYVALWGNDITGNGSRLKPWATIQKAIDTINNSTQYIIVGSGFYNQYFSRTTGTTNIIIGDGHVIFDGNNLPLTPGPNPTYPTYLFKKTSTANIGFIGITIKNYINVIECPINFSDLSTLSGNNSVNTIFYNCLVENCQRITNRMLPSSVNDGLWSENTVFYNIQKACLFRINPAAGYERLPIHKTSFIKCKAVYLDFSTVTSDVFIRDNVFLSTNIWIYNDGANSLNSFDFFSFYNCNWRFGTSGLTPQLSENDINSVGFPDFGNPGSIPANYQYISDVATLKYQFEVVFGAYSVPFMENVIASDPLINIQEDIADVSLNPLSPVRSGAAGTGIAIVQRTPNTPSGVFGPEFGARGVGIPIRSGVNFDNSTIDNLSLIDNGDSDFYTLTSTASLGYIRSEVINLVTFKEINMLDFFGNIGYLSGQYITDNDNLGTPVTIAASPSITTLTNDQAYVVAYDSPEPITFFGSSPIILFPGDKFTAVSGENQAQSEFGVAKVIPITDANNYDFVYMRISQIPFASNAGSPTFFKYKINQKPMCNRVGNFPTGDIVAGNADTSFDPSVAFPVRAKYVQIEFTIQNNNLY